MTKKKQKSYVKEKMNTRRTELKLVTSVL